MLGLFAIGGLFLYAFPLRVATSWPEEPLRIAQIHPISFQLSDYLISAALDTTGQVKLAAAGQWEVTPKDGDRELLLETFRPGDMVRMERDADNWRQGTVSRANFINPIKGAARFSVTLDGESSAGALGPSDVVTIVGQGWRSDDYPYPLQARLTTWPDEPLKISHIYPLTFEFADYTVTDSLTTEGQFKLVSDVRWEVSAKTADQALFSELFKLGHGVRAEQDADNWRGGSVSGASYLDAADTTPAYFVVALTATTTAGTLASGDTVTIESVR